MRAQPDNPRVVIVGGGFGGLAAAKALAGAAVEVTLIDKHNYHLFQPLLYQVATAALTPADIASPIRGILRAQKNATVYMDAVVEIGGTRKTGADGAWPPLALRWICAGFGLTSPTSVGSA